ncbi:MAG: hypothetical protein D6746_05355 [Bacteroidetes bacterium]|nr:MAG: hypothetical protein D6746_05355 [Bacteroidota bacterium]
MKPVGGLLAVQDSVLRFDDGYTGDFKDVMISTGGLLDDFYVSDYWSMSVVADQVVLTAAGGTPKVFDGQIARPGGLRRTGQPRFSVRVFSSSVVNGRWQKGAWYGLVIAYVDQADNIVHVMPRITFKVSNATDVVGIRGLPPHPDPRVTGIQIYLTGPKLDAMTAYRAPVSLARHTTFDVKGSWWDGSTYTAANIIVSHDTYPAILDEQITPMPVCAYSTSYNDRLVMAGDPALPDAVYWSAPGSPERFDVVADRVILEDASGDRITGLVTAFDSVVIFKENSVWRMSETAPGVMTPVKITDSLGCIAPRSIKVVSDPNTGSVGVVFWSKLGPYWFDGVKFAYLGDAVESLYGRGRFEFIQDPTLISTIHAADSSLLLFCYGSGQDPAVLDKALCFDYRNGIWSEFSGMIGGVSMTAMVRHTDRAVYSMGGTTDLAVDVAKSSLMVLFAGNNGRIYRWGAFGSAHDWINYDGLPDGVTGIGDELTLTGGSSSNMTFAAGTLPSSGLEGLWVTVYKSDYSQYGLFRIIGHDDSTIYYDTSLAPSYTPAAGDKARIGLPFLEAETGWDSLDAPHLTKELIESYVWGEQQWRLQLLSDWEAIPTVRTWESLNLSSQSFDRVQWNRLLKNAKLLMLSGDLDARLDYMTHTVNYLQESSD